MRILFVFTLLSFGYVFSLWKWAGMKEVVAAKWDSHLNIEKKALLLAKENRLLLKKISDLQYQVASLESKSRYFVAKNSSVHQQRSIASVSNPKVNDLVNYEIYKWTPEKLLAIGEKEFHFNHYEKSAQYYRELIERFPKHKIIDDRVLFGAGVAAFETGKRYDWSVEYLGRLVTQYPQSRFYRGAKLWLALAHYNQGERKKFLKTIEEFRLKYRNTDEWKILSRYYENMSNKVNL